ncbi:MAG: FAD-binding oxidoreductase [Hyphomicrobiaceae bacterium]|nr:FAD-binding oxidoreductase [Hyphomicrobiaceae bacterium]MCC0024331.1 FAD-binding oxidoreductase [Hyphomicrobiaceae bacterium]
MATEKQIKGQAAAERLKNVIPAKRLKTDPLYTFAYSGDASYFRLVPALVVIVESEDEVREVMKTARAVDLPVTFRAAGTSLSGQAITEGILCVLGDSWRHIRIHDNAEKVTLGPAMIVANANAELRPFAKKIGPDPASQAACKIGGVVNNNSSGMCCGVVQNTYHTMDRLRLILTDGTLLDSGDPASRDAFRLKRPDMIEAIETLRDEVRRDNELVDLIHRKYAIKNTVGYSLNALVDHDDPIDILTHLIVGSEGTLGFVSEITYNTVPDHPFKATGLVPFETNHKAAQAIEALHHVGVSAAEFMERKALATVEDKPAIQPILPVLGDNTPAVLIEIMAENEEALAREVEEAVRAMQPHGLLAEPQFTHDPAEADALWDVRKGLFASAGASRPRGTVMLTEDVAVPIHRLADAVDDLRALLDKHGYVNGIVFGHTLAGNLHFQMDANFTDPVQLAQFEAFSDELATMVSVNYQGSLKAEHGTGRHVAPYVEQEWGKRAYKVMHRVKEIFDDERLLNPGVLLNEDPEVHLKSTKQMAPSNDLVDYCIECGFCESVCPSAGLTLTPRQRIVMTRERERLRKDGEDDDLLKALDQGFVEAGMDTCAACNLCSTKCPVGIETGTMILGNRAKKRGGLSDMIADLAANNLGLVEGAMGAAVATQGFARNIGMGGVIDGLSGTVNNLTGHKTPTPNQNLRAGPGVPKAGPVASNAPRGRVVYFPACASRMFGSPKTHLDLLPVTGAMIALLKRAGFNPVLPEKLDGACCGQPFLSKGFPDKAKEVGGRLHKQLDQVSGNGKFDIVTDMSTCSLHLKQDGQKVADSAEFLLAEVLPHLTIGKKIDMVAVHHNCSAQRMKEQQITEALAAACADEVAVLKSVTCCGYAGDKGLYRPDLNAHALRFAKNDVPDTCRIGVSTVSTCAVGLSDNLGIPFVSLTSLLEFVSRP